MRFFDSKEEVLDIQLTQYGRYLLSKGAWKPEYYAFFDEGVIYDANHGNHIDSAENKNSAETRIQEETPYFRTQTGFSGRDEFLFDSATDLRDRIRLATYEKLNVMPLSLGTSTLESTKVPAYKIRFLEGKIQNLEFNLTGNLRTEKTGSGTTVQNTYSQQLLKIPQIDLDVEFKISVEERGTAPKFEEDPALVPGNLYADGSQVYVGPDQIIVVIEEENASFDYENFDIEVFEIKDETGNLGEPVLAPLSFIKPLQMVVDNKLINQREAELQAGRVNGQLPELDPTYVEYYFDINVDGEIDENTLCRSASKLKSTDLFNDLEINCPDLRNPSAINIYGTDALSENCPDY